VYVGNCRTKFVKNQYKFSCDSKFVAGRCRKVTVRLNERCNMVTVAAEKRAASCVRGGERLPERVRRSEIRRAGQRAESAAPADPHQGRSRDRVAEGQSARGVLGVPLGARAAHVVELRPVGVV
jgi:hypothetical protein